MRKLLLLTTIIALSSCEKQDDCHYTYTGGLTEFVEGSEGLRIVYNGASITGPTRNQWNSLEIGDCIDNWIFN